ncbi:MAG: hypothetical protein QOE95_2056, partial [Gaiellaceae bacterium]|nr:hypothetical protein [Gaiellaceae bacterium]
MPHRPLSAVALAAFLLPAVAPAAPAAPSRPSPWKGKLSPCALEGGAGKGFCGAYEVFEDRETRSGRKIPLKIVVLPAKGPHPAPDPVFILEGGPG